MFSVKVIYRWGYFIFLLCCSYSNAETIQGGLPTAINFYNGEIKLSGSLYFPVTKKPSPAIVITHGSGKDSKSDAGYISLAHVFVQQGFVVLLYDKRGVGGSSGTYLETPDMSIPAGDLVCAVNYVQTRSEVNKNRIGVYGHSQGGWVAPLAAGIAKNISFVIVTSGGGVSILEQNLYAFQIELRKEGMNETGIDAAIHFGRQLFTYLATGVGYTALNPLYTSSIQADWFSLYKKMGFGEQLPPPSMLKNPVFNFFKVIQYDPQSILNSLSIPALVIFGERDETIPAIKAKQRWEDSFFSGGNQANLTVVILPAEDHYVFERHEGSVRYKKSFETILTKWVQEKISTNE